jgi:hypothetical protein
LRRARLALLLAASLAPSACIDVQVDEEDRKLFVTREDVEALGWKLADLEVRTRTKKVLMNMGRWNGEMEYECETPDGAEVSFYAWTNVMLRTTALEAIASDKLNKTILTKRIRRIEERPGAIAWGDTNYYAIVKNPHGDAVGLFYLGRKGRRVYQAGVVGIDIEDDDDERLRGLIREKLAAFDARRF